VCPPGRYFASIYTPWDHPHLTKEICFTTYAEKDIHVKPLPNGTIKSAWIAAAIGNSEVDEKAGWKSYESQGEPDIAYKYEEGAGIGFIAFHNTSTTTTLNCMVNFASSYNMFIQPPYDGTMKPYVVNEPGEIDVVWFRKGDYSSCAYKVNVQFHRGTDELRQEAIAKGRMYSRLFEGDSVGISLYILYHSGGAVYQFENNSEKHTLEETIEFKLSGCHILGSDTNSVRIEVYPGKNKTVQIENNGKFPRVRMVKDNYRVY